MNDLIPTCQEEVPKSYSVQQLGPLEKLKVKKEAHENALKDINEAIAALESNPEFTRVITLVSKAQRY